MEHIWQRDMALMTNGTGLSMAATDGGNSTFMVINEFRFLAARSIRTSTIILSVFNTVSAFATAAGILFECYLKAKRNRARRNQKVNIFRCVRGTETFPFILSLGITAQGIIFAVSQSHGLDGLFKAGCSLISQFMWPAIFIVPYIQLVFGLEVTIRGLRTKPFPSRGKWDVVICLVLIKILLVVTGLVAFFIRAPNFCFASLFWFVAKWAEGAFALFTVMAVVLASCITTIYIKLRRHSTIETSERVGASRMIYYLIVAVLSNILMVPFFISLTFSSPRDGGSNSSLTLATISSVVANVSGLLTGGLYLFLRSSTISTIGPKDKIAEYERQQKLKHNIRLQGLDGTDPDDDDDNGGRQMVQSPNTPRPPYANESQENLVPVEKGYPVELSNKKNSIALHSNPYVPSDSRQSKFHAVSDWKAIPKAPEPARMSAATTRPLGRRPSTSYSLFPSNQTNNNNNNNNNNTDAATLLPSTTYTPNPNMNPNNAGFGGGAEPPFVFAPDAPTNSILQPPPLPGPDGFRHNRNSSMGSSATVQIGLRFSNVNDIGPAAMERKDSIDVASIHDLGCPNNNAPLNGYSQRPSPLTQAQRAESVASSTTTHVNPPSVSGSVEEERQLQRAETSEIMKNLPPVPAPAPTSAPAPAPAPAPTLSSGPTLSPTVYTPPGTATTAVSSASTAFTKVSRPSGVGFNLPKRVNTTPEPSVPVPVPAPLRIRGFSNAEKGREDWI